MATIPTNHEPLQALLEQLGNERRLDFGLDRFKQALERVGNPTRSVHSLIIGGTNGKGSTSLFLSAVLIEAGFKVQTYLSPHLQSPAERILMGLAPIDESKLRELILEFMPLAKELGLSYFELLTLINFIHAQRESVDLLVLEVGLGGRLDATNVTDPLACVVTNIDYDHQEYLGDTLEKILHEKLGILNAEGLLFTGIDDPKLLRELETRCATLDTIYYYTKELRLHVDSVGWKGQRIRINDFPFELTNPTPGTVKNAALAFLTARIVFPKIPIGAFQRAFRRVVTPGRFEIVQHEPRVILSGDHNPAGLQCLEATLKEMPRSGRLLMLCGFSPDKPFAAMFATVKKISDRVLVTRARNYPPELPDGYESLGEYIEDPVMAVKQLLSEAQPEDTVLVTGSLYLVGAVRPLWHSRVEFLKASPVATPATFVERDEPILATLPAREPRQIHAP